MNNEQDYSMVTSFNWNPSKNLFYLIKQKNRTFLNQKFWVNIIYKLDVQFRFHDHTRIS